MILKDIVDVCDPITDVWLVIKESFSDGGIRRCYKGFGTDVPETLLNREVLTISVHGNDSLFGELHIMVDSSKI